MYRKNTATQYIYFGLINSTSGDALTGATVTAYRALDGAAQASATGTTTELGNGQYRFNLSQADTNANNGSYLFTATNAIPVEKTVVFTAADPTDATAFGISRIDAAITSRMATYTQPTGFLAATFPTTVASPTNITAATGVVLSGVTHTGAVIPTVSAVTGLTASNLDAAVSSRLAPTVSGRTLDVTATGAAGIDWANVENVSANNVFSSTYIGVVGNADYISPAALVKLGLMLAQGYVETSTSTTVTVTFSTQQPSLDLVGALVILTFDDDGERKGQVRIITGVANVLGFIRLTVHKPWNINPSSGDEITIVPGITTAEKVALGAIDADALAQDAADKIAETVQDLQVLTRLDSMIESDGAGQFRYDTIALSMAAGGGGGGTDWTANERTAIRSILGFDSSGTVSLPTVGVMDAIKDKTDLITSSGISVLEDRVNESTITMQYNESTTATVNLDENTTSATLQFVVSRPDGTDILTIANGSITRTSTSFTVTITTAVTATLGQYLWSLRDITGGTNRVVIKGVLTVQNAASA